MVADQIVNEVFTAPRLEFSAGDLQYAHDTWKINCGPAALAASAGINLGEVRRAVSGFEGREYMTQLDMHAALARLRLKVTVEHSDGGFEQNIWPTHGLCLIQWSGPWLTDDKPNLGWALKHTHWVASKFDGTVRWVFDVNAGQWLRMQAWSADILPQLLASDKHRDGTWWLRHSWEVRIDRGNRSRKSV
jgi:hypothetical protein